MKPAQNLVASPVVRQASFHVPLPIILRFYVWLFILLYGVYLWAVIFHHESLFGSSSEGRNLALVILCSLNALAFLVTHWSVTAKARMTCYEVKDPFKAKVIRVIPEKHHGAGSLCEIKRQIILDEEDNMPKEHLYFEFQQRKFIYSASKGMFSKLRYPTSYDHDLEHFFKSDGIRNEEEWNMARDKFGRNYFDIPIPSFQELFQQHMVAPFFVFQLFCVALWFLDDMWYYSLFTLLMLFVFESTVVMQRLQSLREMRSMSTKPYALYAHRGGKWGLANSDSLMPGDVVSITRSKDETPVPCDVLLLDGSAIANEAMLSGESTPLMKESIVLRDRKEKFDERGSDKLHILYGGTKILQVSPPTTRRKMVAPDGGALCYVLRTGFGTTQGKLVRTIVYSTERVTANNLEAFVFIIFLLVFALMAASYVWIEGTKNELRKRSKILLECVLIMTSVVPPELPMELSLAVNNALIALMKGYVFCTEPFRIPFAGKLDILAFDKTGTLTDTNLVVEGLGGLSEDSLSLMEPRRGPFETTITLAAAHALVLLDDGVVGDPMEKATLDSIMWSVGKSDTMTPKSVVAPKETKPPSLKGHVRILRRFQFSSALKRMSSIATYSEPGGTVFHFVAVKGAPETLRTMLKEVPAGYDEMYKNWAKEGSRVLALGFKKLTRLWTANEVREASRDSVESNLQFAGFLVFHCPLKEDSVAAIEKLNASSHRTIMITGDNALTACHVAKQVGIINKPPLILDDRLVSEERGRELAWQDLDESITIPCDPKKSSLDPRLSGYHLCATGAALAEIDGTASFSALLPRIWVYARVSPTQKESILTAFNQMGFTTLMCGDGTNDVGALKQAHVGVALLDGIREDVIKQGEIARHRRSKEMQEKQKKLTSRLGFRAAAQTNTEVAQNAPNDPRAAAAQQAEDSMSKLLDELEADIPVVKFGDASVASPFTSKISSIMSVRDIVRQGRATLVAMMQMYRILALNCIISAYSMSVLYLSGIKQGDWQATIAGILLTVCFFAIAKSTPLDELSKQRPLPNIFNLYFFLSVLGQSAVHVGALAYIRAEAIKYSEIMDEEIDLDADFAPNLLNTAVFLISLTMQIATFAVNYQGRPFRESLTDNKPLWVSIRGVGSIVVISALQYLPFVNEILQLVPMPFLFQRTLLMTMFVDIGLAWVVEDTMKTLFSDARPKAGLLLED